MKYHPPGKPAVLTEKRTLEVSPPAADGAYFIDWLGVFTAGDTDVLLDRTPILGQPNGVVVRRLCGVVAAAGAAPPRLAIRG